MVEGALLSNPELRGELGGESKGPRGERVWLSAPAPQPAGF